MIRIFRTTKIWAGVSFFVLTILFGSFYPVSYVFADQAADAAQAKLQAEYDDLQKDITKWQGILNDTKAKSTGLQGDIKYLDAKIKEAQLTIQAKNIAIQKLGGQINDKNKKISDLNSKIEKGKASLAQILRKTKVIDAYSLPQIMLDNRNLSDFYKDLDTFSTVQKAMHDHFVMIDQAKVDTEIEKKQLDEKKNQEADAKHEVEVKKTTITQTKVEKNQLLTVTKGQEAAYQTVLAEKQAKAAKIRAALFKLRDTQGISFGDALQYANVVSAKTGVRSALILAILTQESDLGKNQGSCLVTNLETGDGVGKNSGTPFERVMFSTSKTSPNRPNDTKAFEQITSRLGRDWKTQPVSCPPGYTYFVGRGFGGGMGPSQFIPSTWEGLKNRIGGLLGIGGNEVDPWNPQDAFMATGLYLSDLGASGGSFTSERNAACKYYSGSTCQPGRKPANVFYGDQVMQNADSIQSNIDFLKGL